MRKHPPWLKRLSELDAKKDYSTADLARIFEINPNSILRGLKGAGFPPEIRPVQVETVQGIKTRYVAIWSGKELLKVWEDFTTSEGESEGTTAMKSRQKNKN